MRDASRLTAVHRSRLAVVYIRQSTYVQVERNRESTARQYDLVGLAVELGWAREAVVVIDEDLGVSGSGLAPRSGFARLAAEVGLGHVGIVLSLEASRLARSNADWYRLLDLCKLTGTLIADTDGIYDPADYSDRLVLGLKGTMSEAELHVLRARLHGGIRNKANRGELRCGLPVGLVWGDDDGVILLHPDEAVRGAITTVFDRFDELGSARATWIWYRGEGLSFPYEDNKRPTLEWVTPTYLTIHKVLTHPAYAGAYVYGRTRQDRYLDNDGRLHTRRRILGMDEHSGVFVHPVRSFRTPRRSWGVGGRVAADAWALVHLLRWSVVVRFLVGPGWPEAIVPDVVRVGWSSSRGLIVAHVVSPPGPEPGWFVWLLVVRPNRCHALARVTPRRSAISAQE